MVGYDEMMKGQADRLSGHPNSVRTEKSVGSESAGLDMHIEAPLSNALDDNRSFMKRAVDHVNRETQRGEHAPMVGGYKHDHTMR